MQQTQQVLTTLKKQLRQSGITYKAVAEHLGLSEASVKRLFSGGGFTLERLEQTCELVGLDFATLVELCRDSRIRIEALSIEQEQEIAEDTELLLVAISVINGFSYDDLLHVYELDALQCTRKLAQLDKLKLLDIEPGNRIRLRVAPNFQWRKNGPIQRYFQEKVQQEFFNSRFEKQTEKLLVLNGILSTASNTRLQELMERLYEEFNHLMQADARLPLANKKGNTMVIALRQWQYPLFRKYMRG